ncbi:hypothetical protein [Tabrizicola sp.]|uniref:hypothetical protein n=1 Tax=Tabrizicola sp. TaxID=2005166 RepID=UPI0027371B33|nr:hypothetical protein [Tabrizicola sp.]MDP3196632.1 hypothetical protein [Tabrizicola sp.]
MMLAAIALTMLGGLFPFAAADVRVDRYTPTKGWVLEVRQDGFTQTKTCILKARRMVYRTGVVTFQLRKSLNTANALYRLDAGPALSVGLVGPRAAGLGAEFKSDNTKNPSDGRVHIPASELKGFSTVFIRTPSQRRATAFDLNGLGQALAAAKAQGCDVS